MTKTRDFKWRCELQLPEKVDPTTPRRYLLSGEIKLRDNCQTEPLAGKRVLFIAHSPPPLDNLTFDSWNHKFPAQGGVFASFPTATRAMNFRYWSIVNMHPRISVSSAKVVHETVLEFANENWKVITDQCEMADAIIVCWGSTKPDKAFQAKVFDHLQQINKSARIFGLTDEKSKQPRHIHGVSAGGVCWDKLPSFAISTSKE
jgi:hypothetical protein